MKSLLFAIILMMLFTSCYAHSKKHSHFLYIPKVELDKVMLATPDIFSVANIARITTKQIKLRGATNFIDILQGEDGIQVFTSNGNINQPLISIRGFAANAFANTLVLVDGIPLNNPDVSPANLNLISLRNVASMQILPASEGVLYGDQAVGGVVNIITKQPKKFTADSGISYGSYQQQIYHASIANKLPSGWYYRFFVEQNNSDNYRQHNHLHLSNLEGKLGYVYHSGQVYLHYFFSRQFLQFPGALTRRQVESNPTQANANSLNDDTLSYANWVVLAWQQHFKHDWNLDTHLSASVNNTQGFLFTPFQQHLDTYYLHPVLSGPLQINYLHIKTTSGAELLAAHYRNQTSVMPQFNVKNARNMASLYTHWNIALAKQWHVILGGRWAQNDNHVNQAQANCNVWVSEQGLNYLYNKHLRFYLRRAGNYRFPKADEQNNFMPGHAITPLKTQTGVSYEGGIAWHNHHVDFQASLYQLNINNEIAFAPILPNQPRATNRNLDPTQRRGVVLSSALHLTHNLIFYLNYAYVHAVFHSGLFSGKNIPFVANHVAKIALGYSFWQHWHAYIAAIITGSRFPIEDDANRGRRLGGYTIYNANIGYYRKHWSVNLRLNNISGKRFYNYVLLPAGSSQAFFYPAPQRNFLLSVNYDFC